MTVETESEEPRLHRLVPAELDADQRALYDAITRGRRARGPQAFALTDDAGGLRGPFNAMLLTPAIGAALQQLGSTVRYAGALTERAREIAILTVATHWDSGFERHAHEAVGRAVGLSEEELRELRGEQVETLTDPVERCVLDLSRALVERLDLTGPEYDGAVRLLGPALVFELTTLVGYYSTLALQLRVFRVDSPR